MLKKELVPGVMVYSNVMPEHESIIEDLEDVMSSGLPGFEWKPPYIIKDGENVVDSHIRDLNTFGIPYDQAMILQEDHATPMESFNNILGNKFFSAFNPVEQDYKQHYHLDTVWHDMYNILKYGKDHFFKNHIDDSQTYHRKMSTVYYLNDNYKGGEIVFPRFNLEYKPNANEMLIFPSSFVYNHSVNKVKNGTRYAVVSWLN